MNSIQTFSRSDDLDTIKHFFKSKRPFVLKNFVNVNFDLNSLEKEFGTEQVLTLNEESNKETLTVNEFLQKIKNGEKYRLRANTKLGNKIKNKFDTSYQSLIRENKHTFMDTLLSLGDSSRQHTLFVSSKGCTFTKHAHVISGFILQVQNTKDWYFSKNRDSFSSIRYKSFLNPNPLYVTDKNPKDEYFVRLNEGDILYMPPYWFHYTISTETNMSYSYFFTEKISYYLKNTFLMFTYQFITNPIQSLLKAVRQEPEEHIYDKDGIMERCNKIKNAEKRKAAIEFFAQGDFS